MNETNNELIDLNEGVNTPNEEAFAHARPWEPPPFIVFVLFMFSIFALPAGNIHQLGAWALIIALYIPMFAASFSIGGRGSAYYGETGLEISRRFAGNEYLLTPLKVVAIIGLAAISVIYLPAEHWGQWLIWPTICILAFHSPDNKVSKASNV